MGGLLFDGDRGAQPFDVIHVWLVHLIEELAGVGGEAFDVAALSFGVDGVEGETGFSRAAESGDDGEFVAGDCCADVFEVMFARAFDRDEIVGRGCCFFGGHVIVSLRVDGDGGQQESYTESMFSTTKNKAQHLLRLIVD